MSKHAAPASKTVAAKAAANGTKDRFTSLFTTIYYHRSLYDEGATSIITQLLQSVRCQTIVCGDTIFGKSISSELQRTFV